MNVQNQDSVTKILDMVPDFVNKFTSGKKEEKIIVEEVDDADEILKEAAEQE